MNTPQLPILDGAAVTLRPIIRNIFNGTISAIDPIFCSDIFQIQIFFIMFQSIFLYQLILIIL